MPVKEQGLHTSEQVIYQKINAVEIPRDVFMQIRGVGNNLHQLLVILLLFLGGILDPALAIDLDYKHKQMGREGGYIHELSFSVAGMVLVGSCKDKEEKKVYGPHDKPTQLAQVRLAITEKEGAIYIHRRRKITRKRLDESELGVRCI